VSINEQCTDEHKRCIGIGLGEWNRIGYLSLPCTYLATAVTNAATLLPHLSNRCRSGRVTRDVSLWNHFVAKGKTCGSLYDIYIYVVRRQRVKSENCLPLDVDKQTIFLRMTSSTFAGTQSPTKSVIYSWWSFCVWIPKFSCFIPFHRVNCECVELRVFLQHNLHRQYTTFAKTRCISRTGLYLATCFGH